MIKYVRKPFQIKKTFDRVFETFVISLQVLPL